jgi:AAA domain
VRMATRDPLEGLVGTNGRSHPLPAPTVERAGDDFVFRWAAYPVELSLNAIRESSDGVHAELTVTHERVVIHWSRLGLASSPAREGLTKKLAGIESEIPWREMLEHACRATVQTVRRGNPAVAVVPRRREGARHLVDPIATAGETSVIAGDGGAGKSLFGLGLALAVTSGATLPGGMRAEIRGPVLWLDWESTEEEIAERALLLAKGLGCRVDGLHYKAMIAPLTAEIAAVRADVSRLHAVAVIVDSLAPASGAEPEGADSAVRTMAALRSLSPASRVVIAHVSKAAAEGHVASRPFGSVFVQNLARSVWEARRSDDDSGKDLLLALYHHKVNSGAKHRPIALRFAFEPDRVTLHSADLAEAPDLMARATVGQRIKAALSTSPLTTEEIAAHLDAKVPTVRKTLERMRKDGGLMNLPGTEPLKWALPSRRTA